MPYIKPQDRTEGARLHPCNIGALNYAITTLIDDYLSSKGLQYSEVNAVIGALECAKLELYRRVAAPYEDHKIYENGDVYSPGNLV